MRRALIAAGLLVMGFATVGALTDPDVKPLGVVIFLAVVLVAHDALLLPAIIGIGALVGRLPDPAPVRVAAICSAAVTLVGLPLLIGYADLPASRLLLALVLIWAAVPAAMTVRRIRKHLERSSSARNR